MKLLKESTQNSAWSFGNDQLTGLVIMIGEGLYKMVCTRYPKIFFNGYYIGGKVFAGDDWDLDPDVVQLGIWAEVDQDTLTLDKLKDLQVFLKSNTDYLLLEVLIPEPLKFKQYISLKDLTEDDLQRIIDCYLTSDEVVSGLQIIVKYKLLENPFFFV